MKPLKILLFAVAMIPPFLSGCGQPGSQKGDKPVASNQVAAPTGQPAAPTYKIVGSRAVSNLNVIEVRVSPGSPNAVLAQWSREIMQKNKDRKNVQINFYDAEPGKNALIARYEKGKLFDPLRPGRILVPAPR
jgi:hypothetical protein